MNCPACKKPLTSDPCPLCGFVLDPMGPIEFPKGAFRADDYIEINPRTATQANFDALRQEGKVILLNSPAPEDVALATKLFQDSVRRSPMQ